MNTHRSETREDIVLVVGMHRSGTSLVTNLLREAGFFVGLPEDLIPPDRWNEKGYFEQWDVYRLNEQILQSAGGSWFEPPPQARIVRQDRHDAIQRIIERFKDRGPGLIKDPRLCLTLPLWRPHLNEGLRIIWVLRSAHAVAASLQKRDGIPCWRGRELWRIYNRRAMAAFRGLEVFTINYETFFDEREKKKLSGLARFLGLRCDIGKIAEQMIDPRLNHHGHVQSGGYPVSGFQSLHEQSLACLQAGRREEAIHLLENLLRVEPDHALAHNDLGVLYFQAGKPSLALRHFQRAIEEEPGNEGFSKNLLLARKAMTMPHS